MFVFLTGQAGKEYFCDNCLSSGKDEPTLLTSLRVLHNVLNIVLQPLPIVFCTNIDKNKPTELLNPQTFVGSLITTNSHISMWYFRKPSIISNLATHTYDSGDGLL